MKVLSKLQVVLCVVLSGSALAGTIALPAVAGSANWRIEPAPGPKSSTDGLESVSCANRFTCMLVGESGVNAEGGLFVERRVSGRWSLQPITTPTVRPRPDVTTGWVSCQARNDCTLVGNVEASGIFIGNIRPGSLTFADRWDGYRWHLESIPHGTDGRTLRGIDCRASLPCLAVGDTLGSFGQLHPLIERRVAGRWRAVGLPSRGIEGAFGAVACADRNLCLAVGSTTEVWNGRRWRRAPAPAHPGGGFAYATVTSVSCSSHHTCLAVGAWGTGSSSPTFPLVDRWSAGGWHIEATPVVPDAVDAELSGISCERNGSCVAVGAGSNPSGTMSFPVIERRQNGRWTLQQPQQPQSTDSSLGGVSCAAGACTAVGIYLPGSASSGAAVPLIERHG